MIRDDCILNPCTAVTHHGCCVRDCGRYEKKENKMDHKDVLFYSEFKIREASRELYLKVIDHIGTCDEIIHSSEATEEIKTKAKIQIEKWKFLYKVIEVF